MSELFDKQVNAQEEKNFRGSRKLLQAHEKVCNENERKLKKKNDGRLKYFCWKGGIYKVIVEHSCNGYQTTPA